MTKPTRRDAKRQARHGRRAVALACALTCALAPAAAAEARLGDLDPTFSGDGIATPDVGSSTVTLRAAALDPGGAVLAGGSATDGNGVAGLFVLKLTAGGALDPSFAGGGHLRWLPRGGAAEIAALTREAGGSYLAAGAIAATDLATDPQPYLARITPGGTQTEIPLGITQFSLGALTGVATLPDGRIVVGGWGVSAGRGVFFAARLTAAGQRDGTFDQDGVAVADFGTDAHAAALALDATGAVTLTGFATPPAAAPVPQAAVARFTSTGAPDGAFSGDGKLVIDYATQFPGQSQFSGAAMHGSSVLAAGTLGGDSRGVLQRLLADGSFDPAHGSAGAPLGAALWQGGVAPRFNPRTLGEAVAARPGGGAVVAGRTGNSDITSLQTAWFTPAGVPDPAGGGVRTHAIGVGQASPPLGLALGAGESLVVAGASQTAQPFVARFAPNAAPVAALSGPAQLTAGEPAAYSAGGSTDPEGEALHYSFDLDGNGSYEFDGGENPLAFRSYAAPGSYTLGVRVTDPHGASATAARSIAVGAAPIPPPRPLLGKQGVAKPVRGTVRVRFPGKKKFVPLTDLTAIPNGTEIDARKGRVQITVLHDAGGRLDGAVFYAGRFIFRQGRGATPITTLRLSGGSFKHCTIEPKAGGSALAFSASVADGTGTRSRRRVRRLWGNGRGRFRTRGRYGAATVRGTKWLTLDRCDGTKVRVVRGKVAVQDLVHPRRRARIVTAGEQAFVPYKGGG